MSLRAAFTESASVDDALSMSFRAGFVAAVFDVLEVSVKRLRTDGLAGFDEVAITGELARHLRDVVLEIPVGRYGYLLAVHDDEPVRVPHRIGKRRPRVDLQIEQISVNARPRFSLEAKRLRKPEGRAVAAYLGRDGLGCFTSLRYAKESGFAGMLAYVQSGRVVDWAGLIEAKLRGMRGLRSGATGVWSRHELRGPRSSLEVWTSRHARRASSDVVIYHSMVDLIQASRRSAARVRAAASRSRS